MGPGECNSFTLTLLACLMVTPCVPTILTPAVLTFLLLYNLWFEHHSTNSPINQVYTVTLAVDIAGAFDKVSHPGVLAKAQQCGIHGQLLAWLRSYLHDRNLTVVVGGQSSPLFPIKAGVPQGSLLGPTLFLLYVNDAEQCLAPGSSLAVYADDTTLYALIRNPDTIAAACNSLQASIDRLQTWGAQWKIKFEAIKISGNTP